MPVPPAAVTTPDAAALSGILPAVAPAPAALLSTDRVPGPGRGVSLAILATLAVVFALDWAQSFVISLLLGVLFAYTLNPLVVSLERARIPRVAGASIVMVAVVVALGLGAYSLRGQVQTILDQVPEAASKLSAGLAGLRRGQDGALRKMQTAATEIEKATSEAAGAAPAPKQPATRVIIDTPGFRLGDFLWAGSRGAAGLVGQAAMVVFLTYFLLLSGGTYKRKLMRLSGPSLSSMRITVHILDDINESIQRYMLMLVATNVLLGLLTWVALRWIGLENAGAWAVAAGLLHVIPYFGPAITAGGVGMAAFMQFDALPMALLAAGASLATATLVGTFVTTWLTGRIARLNTAAVFVSLLFWGWLWGVWGLLLSIPIIVIVKVVAQHVEKLQPVAELLGD